MKKSIDISEIDFSKLKSIKIGGVTFINKKHVKRKKKQAKGELVKNLK
ncbi:MAG: hypothetical protein JSW41_04640 [Candidatus Aenigmatarchaeota archaeon]|nr:MAG: hypothetical protein JSW41_04640 [Candidatus Aenigmarchaeota archaeon]